MNKSFSDRAYDIVKQIPPGKVATYQDVAILAGKSRASRAVGTAMKNNPDPETIPCHRVIGSDGKMHGYSARGGIVSKIQLLKKEGVVFLKNKVDLKNFRWKIIKKEE